MDHQKPVCRPLGRRLFLQQSTALATLGLALPGQVRGAPAPVRQPVLFIGHGSPLNALRDNPFTQTLRAWGGRLGKPAAILMVSAHWLTPGATAVYTGPSPRTIHDFGGFPRELHEMQYPAPGSPELARLTATAVQRVPVASTLEWGLDHGAWTVLKHLYPRADVPVFQLSIDYSQDGAFHLALGRELRALRNRGVLIIGSGNIVHNLQRTVRGVEDGLRASTPWAHTFDEDVKAALAQREDDRLAKPWSFGDPARLAVPTPDHYWPLLYALGAADPQERPENIFEGFQAGTLSMRCLQFGASPAPAAAAAAASPA